MKLTQEQVIAWAREDLIASYGVHLLETGWPIEFDLSELQQLCTLAYEAGRKDENEACAKVCEAQENRVVVKNPARIEFDPNSTMARKCAAVIRARKEQ